MPNDHHVLTLETTKSEGKGEAVGRTGSVEVITFAAFQKF